MRIKNIILAVVITISSLMVTVPAFAAAGKCDFGLSDSDCNKVCSDSSLSDEQKEAAGCNMSNVKKDMLPLHLKNIINAAISVVGIIAVIVIVFAGQRLITGGGEPERVKQAKSMIIYAIVAIVVATLSWAIINYVVLGINNN